MKAQNREALDALQAVRACGALLVVFDHAMLSLQRHAAAKDLSALAWVFGDIGVYLFFVVSGFVMIYAHRQDFGSPGAPGRFGLRRIGRIVPLYWLFTIVAAADLLFFKHIAVSFRDFAASLFFIPAQGVDFFGEPLLGQGWTLNYEMLFYLIFGLSLWLRNGLVLVFAFFAALVGLGWAGAFPVNSILAFWSQPIVLFFLGGISLGLLRAHTSWRLDFVPALAVAALFAAAAVIVRWTMAHPIANAGATGLCVMAAVAACTMSNPAKGGFLAAQARKLGDATYSTYLVHTFLVGAIAYVVNKFAKGLPTIVVLACAAPISFAVGIAIYRGVEKPLLKLWSAKVLHRPGPVRPG